MRENGLRDEQGRRRVVITGVGVVSPIGSGRDQFWKGLVGGKCGAAPISLFPPERYQFKNRVACEVPGFRLRDYVTEEQATALERYGRSTHFVVAASELAFADASFADALKSVGRERVAVVMGTTMGEIPIQRLIVDAILESGFPRSRIYDKIVAFNIPGVLARHLGARGPVSMIPTACASGAYAVGEACDLIREGRVDAAVAGGVDSFDPVVFAGFSRLFSVAPERCQPFDRNRKGILVGEGAAVMTLESADRAVERGAKIYGEIVGYGRSCDAFHMTNPGPEGVGMLAAMRAAFADAGRDIAPVSAVVVHGTGTPANDRTETRAIKSLFGEAAKRVPVTSNKSMLGHTMGAAGAMNIATASLALAEGRLPPTINYETPDPECDLDCTPNQARAIEADTIMSNAFAFGGNNSSLLIQRWGRQ
jgi:3-oxoacyl-[acyl-carrier-protein] synthase II